MPRKVIYISPMRLSDKVSRDWYIDYLIERGVAVEYWDIIPLLRKEFDESFMKTADYLRTPQSYAELETMLGLPENKGALYVVLFYYEGTVVKLFRLLSRFDSKTLLIAWGAFPLKRHEKWRKVLSGISNPSKLAEKIFYRSKGSVFKKLKLVKRFNVVFAAGHALMASDLYAAKVVPINQPDYDHYRRVQLEGARFVDGRYAVFLDQYLPHHSDLELAGMRSLDPIAYYASLNQFFKSLELKYNVRVIIASHPRADYDADQFNGREIYHGKTPELVKDADFVLAHYSTAISYAVLNRKPLVFMYTDEMATLYKHSIMNYLRDISGYLEASIFNIDEVDFNVGSIIKNINESRYEAYKYNYLTTPASENTTTQEVFYREINNLMGELSN